MQYQFLMFLQNIANPVLDFLANAVTFLGEEVPLILIILFVYWCVDKKKGFAIFSNLITAQIAMNVIKAIVRMPRPFMVHPEITNKRVTTATGYSFPSGHTTGAAAFYPTLGIAFKKRSLFIIALVVAALVGLSRNYLGVHWPLDVLVGYMLGLTIACTLYAVFEKLYDNEEQCIKVSLIIGCITGGIAALLVVLITSGVAVELAFKDTLKNLSICAGGFIGVFIERKKINFEIAKGWKNKILTLLLGVVGVLILMEPLKLLFPGNLYYLGCLVRYGAIGIWATGIYPSLAKKIKLLG